MASQDKALELLLELGNPAVRRNRTEQLEHALRTAFERGLAEQAIGAEYIAHYLESPRALTASRPIQQELPL